MKIRFGECSLDTDSRVLLRGGQPVRITPKAFQLLVYLVEARPRAVAKSELQDKLWPSTFVSEGNLATLVKELRVATGDDARQPSYVRTVHGFGYAFTGVAQTGSEGTHSIVVLPFENGTADSDLDYLCEGIAENVTNALSRVTVFRVLAPRTASRWKGSAADPRTIGRELGVETVIHGRVTGSANQLTIQVDAADAGSGTQIWGKRFRSEAAQLFRVEEDVASEVVDGLRLRLSPDDRSRLVHRYTSNGHAYDLYLRGRFQWNKRTEDGLRRAIEYFERAIVADPEYPLPHSGVADVYVVLGTRDLMPPRDAFSRALQSATRALDLAPDLAEAHVSLGAIAEVHQWDWGEAGRRYRRAIELSPSYATAYQWYALHFARRGLATEAERQMAKAIDLDPFSVIGLTNAAFIAYLARDDVAASERIERALEVDPGSVDALLVRGGLFETAGRRDLAIADYRAAAVRSSHYSMTLAQLGHALARHGERAEAEQILEQLADMRKTQHVSAIDSALVSVGLGQMDEAFAWFEAALREKSGWLVYLKTDRRLDPLREDARFQRLLLAVDLEQGQS